MQLGDRLVLTRICKSIKRQLGNGTFTTLTVVKSVQGLETQGAPGPQLAASNKRQLVIECIQLYSQKSFNMISNRFQISL